MPTNDPLRRAPLKRTGLTLLAALACTTPAAAQTLNIDDTLAYINQRCDKIDGVYYMNISFHRNEIAFMKWRAPLYNNRPGSIGALYEYNIDLFDLRTVNIKYADSGATVGEIYFGCGPIDCVSHTLHESSSSLQSVGDVLETFAQNGREHSVARLTHCREPDRVVNAFKHLQELVGGRIADPVDPFAN